ncbi:MAG: aminotransferase class V-fold PLP-dependent enzyme [Ornithinimicrobium sp.]|uniref:aminotransferase class V-fold PLP-dependent enzyme n=1 Tax=Ornithinimicrobium sp. TaxID=1977084 RepID=UPI003D9AB7F9
MPFAARSLFAPTPGYLNAATLGLPPVPVVSAMQEALLQWQSGQACPVAYGEAVDRARAGYAALVGVPTEQVAVGSQTSVFAGMVAASLPPGAQVVVIAEDFTSIVYPFLVQRDRGITVRQVPRTELAEAVTADTDLVVFSLAQSATGHLADLPAVLAAAQRHGALTFCDVTQAAGWHPLEAARFDLTVCSAYKWLCQLRGTAYLTVRPEVADRLVPVNAGWYAGESVWESVYGPGMVLAQDARRFDVSPAWLSWVGAAAATEALADVPVSEIRDHDVALADGLRERIGQPAQGRPVLTVPDPDGSVARALSQAGATVASRAGSVRLACHLWNDEADVELAAEAIGRARKP